MFLVKHHNLDNLVVIVDINNLIILGDPKNINSLGKIDSKFKAFEFDCTSADGHDFKSLETAMKIVDNKNGKPKAILINTTKGKGVKLWENKNSLALLE